MSLKAGTEGFEYEISSDDDHALEADRYIQGMEPSPYPKAMGFK